MSLVNDMLEDLESRGAKKAIMINAPVVEADQSGIRISITSLYILFFFVAVFATFLSWPYFSNQLLSKDNSIGLLSIESSKEPVTHDVVELYADDDILDVMNIHNEAGIPSKQLKGGAYVNENSNKEAVSKKNDFLVTQNIKPEKSDVELQQIFIADRLEEANLFVELNQLTTPVSESALGSYAEVMELDGNNGQAIAGLLMIIEKYKAMANQSFEKSSVLRWQVYMNRASAVAERFSGAHPDFAVALTELKEIQQDFEDKENLFLADQVKRFSTDEPSIGNSSPEGKGLEPIKKLSSVYQYKKIMSQAKSLIGRKLFYQALYVLQEDKPDLDKLPEYYAMIAGLSHQLKNFEQAVEAYQELLEFDPDSFNYWLGLAVSLDALQDSSGALAAFQGARLVGSVDADSMQYVAERIRYLHEHG